MSQVIVTKDKWKARREMTRQQEKKIDKESLYKQWRRDDISKGYGPITRLIGYASLPIAGLWTGLCAVAALAVWVAISICRGLASVVQPLLKK